MPSTPKVVTYPTLGLTGAGNLGATCGGSLASHTALDKLHTQTQEDFHVCDFTKQRLRCARCYF